MIVKTPEGRLKSERTSEERLRYLHESLEKLSDEEKQIVLEIIKEVDDGDPVLLNALLDDRYLRTPVSMKQFLEDEYYVGRSASTLYPALKKDLIDIVENGPYREVALTGAIGFGKTTSLKYLIVRQLYELSCLKDPQVAFGIDPSSEMIVVLLSKNLDLARDILKKNVDGVIRLSPYFTEYFPATERKDITNFPNNITVKIASAFSERVLGGNVIGGGLDEVNFMNELGNWDGASRKRADDKDVADTIYGNIVRRMKSRFLAVGGDLPSQLVVVSSAGTKGSFMDRKIIEARTNPDIFVRDYSLWDVKPASDYCGRKFNVLVGAGQVRSKIIEYGKAGEYTEEWLKDSGCELISVPVEYKDDFDRNIEGSIRDIAGKSVTAISPFLHRVETIYSAINENTSHPFSTKEYNFGEKGEFLWKYLCRSTEQTLPGGFKEMVSVPLRNPDKPRHIHIDPSLSGDSLGIAMGHIEKMITVKRRDSQNDAYQDIAPYIVMDFMLRVNPPKGEQIFLPDIRSMVYDLMAHGFRLSSFSCDSYNSAEMLQKMKVRGVRNSKILSVDRTTEAYDALKSALYESRLEYYKYEPLLLELESLEFNRVRNKVDHPRHGKKDISDAVAGVILGLIRSSLTQHIPLDTDKTEKFGADFAWITENKIMVTDKNRDMLTDITINGTRGGTVVPFLF